MRNKFLSTLFFFISLILFSQNHKVVVEKSDSGMKLLVDGKNFMINGMNWDYVPIGTNFTYSLWRQSDEFIKAALDAEMSLLKNMGVNTIRVYTGMQPRWITYVYKTYGIYTMLNHTFGRYGLTLNGVWTPVTDYGDAKTKNLLLSEVAAMANEYKNTQGLLLFLLGNENNYGLFWAGAETEDFPEEDEKKRIVGERRGRPMYKLMNDAAIKMKSINNNLPIAICNGDLLFIEIIAEECKDVDIYGTNMYRGKSFTDAFEIVKNKLNMPILFTEFGADAFNSITNKEDQKMQAFYMVENWKEIYLNATGLGKAGNAIGGFTFQFSDGWWKYGQTKNLDIHDNNASWFARGYYLDLQDNNNNNNNNNNNMNEEWFGICAKGETNSKGLYTLYPREAYYKLKEVHSINPLEKGSTAASVLKHFSNINLRVAPVTGNISVNGGFESGDLKGWSLYDNGGKATMDNTEAQTGDWCVKLSASAPSGLNPTLKQERKAAGSISIGDKVQVNFSYKGSLKSKSSTVSIQSFVEAKNGVSQIETFDVTPTASWQTFTTTYTVTGALQDGDVSGGITAEFVAICSCVKGCSSILYLDDISLIIN